MKASERARAEAAPERSIISHRISSSRARPPSHTPGRSGPSFTWYCLDVRARCQGVCFGCRQRSKIIMQLLFGSSQWGVGRPNTISAAPTRPEFDATQNVSTTRAYFWVNSDLDCREHGKLPTRWVRFCCAQPPFAGFHRGICILSECWPRNWIPIVLLGTLRSRCVGCASFCWRAWHWKLSFYVHRLRALLTSLTVDLSQVYRFSVAGYWKTLVPWVLGV